LAVGAEFDSDFEPDSGQNFSGKLSGGYLRASYSDIFPGLPEQPVLKAEHYSWNNWV